MEYCHETIPTSSGLLLASQSPRRRQLLALLGIPFRSVCPVVEEETRADESPAALVARLSREKARAALITLTAEEPLLILACDTTVSLDGESVGKPEDADQATAMLHRLRSRPHAVFTAVTLLDAGSERMETVVARTDVYMRPYTDAEIAAYVASGDPFDKAGAYAIQHPGFHPVERIVGCYANVVGLPLCHLAGMLQTGKWGLVPSRAVHVACQRWHVIRCSVYPSILDTAMHKFIPGCQGHGLESSHCRYPCRGERGVQC